MTELRDLLDQASRPEHAGATPHDLLRAGRGRVRRRTIVRTGAILSVVVMLCASAVALRPWESDPDRGIDPALSPTGPTQTGPTPANPTPSDPTPGEPDPTGLSRRDTAPQTDADADPDRTPPGTELATGQTALVPIDHLGKGEVELTVTGIRRGENSEMTSALEPDLAPSAERGTFWYVDVQITYVSARIGGVLPRS